MLATVMRERCGVGLTLYEALKYFSDLICTVTVAELTRCSTRRIIDGRKPPKLGYIRVRSNTTMYPGYVLMFALDFLLQYHTPSIQCTWGLLISPPP